MIELQKPIRKEDDFFHPPKVERIVPRNTSKRTEEELAQEHQHAERELKKIAALYVAAEGNKKILTTANDRLLRLILRLNPDATAADRLIAYLGRLISEKDAAKGNFGDEQRERERAENIGKVDLFKCRPIWDDQDLKLILEIELIQAKSGISDAQDVRDLARAYQSSLADPNDSLAALRSFHRAAIVYEQMIGICKGLGEKNPYEAPKIELKSLKFLLLVNTAKGSEYLDVDQAVKY